MEADQNPPEGAEPEEKAPEPFASPSFWDLGDRVRGIAVEAARRAVAEGVTRAVAEQLSGETLEARVRPIVEKAVAEAAPAAAAPGQAGPDESRVRQLAAEQVAQALAAHIAGDAFTGRVRELALEVAGPLAAEQASAALPGLLASPEVRERLGELAVEAVGNALGGQDAAALVRREAARLIESCRPPSREEIEKIAMERAGQELGARTLPAGVEAVAGRAAGQLIDKRMAAELARLVSADEFQREVGELRQGLAGAAPAADLTGAAEEFRRGQAGFRTEINSLRDALRKMAARLLEIDPRAQAIAQHVFEEQLAGEALRERIEHVAAKVVEPAVAGSLKEALAGLPGEKQLRELAAAEFQRHFAAAAAGLLADDRFAARVRELAGATASEVFKARLAVGLREFAAGETLAKRVCELAAEAAAPVASEKVAAALTAQLGSQELEKRIADVAGKLVGDRLKPAIAEQLGSKEIEKRIADVSGELLAGRLTQALSQHLGSRDLEQKIGGVAGKLVDDRLKPVLAEQLGSQELEKRVAEVAGALLAERLPAALSEGLGSKELEKRVVRLSREASAEVFGARVTKLEDDIAGRISSGDLEKALGGLRAALLKCADAAELRELGESFGRARGEMAGAVDELRANLEQEVRASIDEGRKRSEDLAGQVSRAEEELAGKLGRLSEDLAGRVGRAEDELGSLPTCLEAMGSVHQRMNRLDQSLDRMPPAEQVNAEIADLRRVIAEAEERLPAGDVPAPADGEAPAGAGGLAGLARSWVGRAREHLSQIEAELAEARAEGRLRALIREETGGMDKDALRERIDERLRETVLELIRGGELQEQLKVTIQKAVAPAPVRRETTRTRGPGRGGGGMELPGAMAAPEFPQAGDSEETLQKMVDSDSFKVALDDRFRVMLDYLKSDVIPREIRKAQEAGGGQ